MNTALATVEFDYKGESHQLAALINIENFVDHEDFYQSVCLTIARENNIGLYTYELEVMMDQEIVFSDAKGYVSACIDNNGSINLEKLKDEHKRYVLTPIIDNLIQKYSLDKGDKNLYNALIQSYLEGEKK